MILKITQKNADEALRAVLERIDEEIATTGALGRNGVEGVIVGASNRAVPPTRLGLDLITHSHKGVLHVGDWVVANSDGTQQLLNRCGAILNRIPIEQVRLLGCNTAVTPTGQQAIQDLVLSLSNAYPNITVFGSTSPLSAEDFDHQGFVSDGLLVDQDHLPMLPATTANSVTTWFTRLVKLTDDVAMLRPRLERESRMRVFADWASTLPAFRWSIRSLDRPTFDACLTHMISRPAVVRGLLAMPEIEAVTPVGQQFQRMTLLLDGHVARVYPKNVPGGVLLVADQDLRDLMETGTELLP